MIEELIRIDLERSGAKVIVFSFEKDLILNKKSKVDFQRQVVLGFLRKELKNNELKIEHFDNGAPYLVGSDFHLSISHSHQFYAIYLSAKSNIGIDVQCIKNNIKKGVHYFVNLEEQNTIELTLENLHLIWSAKEAIYKMFKGEIEFYKDDITINSIHQNQLYVSCKNEKIQCKYRLEEKFSLVYSV
ncbi:MAG: 4'-phosphopantetheinyl transferase superfamily protein [Crocinitomicaceae bacterium]|nr:4'-phosphopantetheinyl transferase superfamily protein [Crocinitomicaceae bacterium]